MQRLFENLRINWDALALPRSATEDCSRDDPSCRDFASLRDIREADLASVASLDVLYRQAVVRGILADSEANHLGFLATAAYCRRVGDEPPALFAHLIRNRRYPATLMDEDWAVSALREERSKQANYRWLSSAGKGD